VKRAVGTWKDQIQRYQRDFARVYELPCSGVNRGPGPGHPSGVLRVECLAGASGKVPRPLVPSRFLSGSPGSSCRTAGSGGPSGQPDCRRNWWCVPFARVPVGHRVVCQPRLSGWNGI